jgi:hypothetical protein
MISTSVRNVQSPNSGCTARFVKSLRWQLPQETEEPRPDARKNGQRRRRVSVCITVRPTVLVEGLHHVALLGRRLPQTKRKRYLAVGQVRQNLSVGPLARRQGVAYRAGSMAAIEAGVAASTASGSRSPKCWP